MSEDKIAGESVKRRAPLFTAPMLALLGLVTAISVIDALREGAPLWLLWTWPIVVSPIGMAIVRIIFEPNVRRGPWFRSGGMFSLRTQSAAFLFGDLVGLPVALWGAGMSGRDGWVATSHVPWFLLSVFVGLAASIAFTIMDVRAYTAGGHAGRLNAPTKRWHDGFVYASCAMLVVYYGGPAVWFDFTGYGWVALLGVVFWLGMGVVDMFRKPDPANLHPEV